MVAGSSTALAQSATQEFSIERFRLSLDKNGIFDVESAEVPKHLSWGVSTWLGYEDDPLVLYKKSTGKRVGALISNRTAGSLLFSIGLWERIQLGFALPIVFNQNDENLSEITQSDLSGFGLGDIRLIPKIALLKGKTSIAIIPTIAAPTAGASDYRGNDAFSFQPELAVSHRADTFRVAANLLYSSVRKKKLGGLIVDDQLTLRVGGALHATESLELGLTYQIDTLGKDPFDSTQNSSMEVIGGPTFYATESLVAFAGAGIGLNNGYGTPDWRAFLGLRFTKAEEGKKIVKVAPVAILDTDNDGIPDAEDECPSEREVVNGLDDSDGCPDEIGVVAVEDGDKDFDGILDSQDTCPQEEEDLDGFEDSDGCPDPDNDGDGVLDTEDKCVMVAGVSEMNGCPDPDRDGDGVVDRLDNCPDEPGDTAMQGCKTKQLVKISDGALEILDVVYFKTSKAKIRSVSFGLLDNIATVLSSHPEIKRIRVEGHTDDRGKDVKNLQLSQRRAEAVVKYLIRKGIANSRLEAKGYGEINPIADNNTNDGRTANRRVEFVIVGESNVQVQQSGPDKDALD